ncbi:hypothetical protein TREMEDRAFT_64973 [Tremella mesenterica DSM 1558]|uniref:uncharacterized protein n=1 Tax=Tremella mesenterica (strain ATCC 24925 / CBS 8224 / DSM 1558 / NBRC 9311 / NRRL Y-6157 / RJB 2259-6 / UBC 559-6) TaxID=578456 RepID=UPI0003F49AE6|nr:uncharacterized protein TREMEDRAFT_64973 [Tremella mesenterica DSM 1558]EIW67104.1 hypothetical protein TREMEDRAFT_64973 [Tremella mesenterica DSM 1558]
MEEFRLRRRPLGLRLGIENAQCHEERYQDIMGNTKIPSIEDDPRSSIARSTVDSSENRRTREFTSRRVNNVIGETTSKARGKEGEKGTRRKVSFALEIERQAEEETPIKLRELEVGWRARRRVVLEDNTQVNQRIGKASLGVQDRMEGTAMGKKSNAPDPEFNCWKEAKPSVGRKKVLDVVPSRPPIMKKGTQAANPKSEHHIQKQTSKRILPTLSRDVTVNLMSNPKQTMFPLTPPTSPEPDLVPLPPHSVPLIPSTKLDNTTPMTVSSRCIPKLWTKPTIPNIEQVQSVERRLFSESSYHLEPILAHPLPPTPHPIPLHIGKKETIYIPYVRYELRLFLPGHKTITVLSGGRSLIYSSPQISPSPSRPTSSSKQHTAYSKQYHVEPETSRINKKVVDAPKRFDEHRRRQEGEEKGKGDERYKLSLDDFTKWTEREKKEWKAVYSLVERFKRSTPRVKIYHPLGQLTLTCSDPPDVILAFDLHCPSVSDTSSTFAHTSSPPMSTTFRSVAPNTERTTNHHQSGVDFTKKRTGLEGTTRVRLLYSRLAKEIRVDISKTVHNQGRRETLRSRRMAELITSPIHVSDRTRPFKTLVLENEDIMDRLSLSDQTHLRRDPEKVHQAFISLGLSISTMESWSKEEIEAVCRLWDLRNEWDRRHST